MHVRTISKVSELESLYDAWSKLLTKSDNVSIFNTPIWLLNWWKAYGNHEEFCGLVVEHEGELVGLACFLIQSKAIYKQRKKTLRFLGDGSEETNHTIFLASKENENEILHLLFKGILDLDFDLLYFSQLLNDDSATRLFIEFLENERWIIKKELLPCPSQRFPTSMDDLYKSMQSRFRTTVRSVRKNISSTFKVEFGQFTNPDDLGFALETFFKLHTSRWTEVGQAGSFASTTRRDFYCHITPELLKANQLKFFYLKLDGEYVAMQYCFSYNKTVYLLQEAYNPELSKHNVGHFLRSLVFEELITEGYKEYDFLVRESQNKRLWSNHTNFDITVMAAKRSLLAKVYVINLITNEEFKNVMRKIPFYRFVKRIVTPTKHKQLNAK